MLEGSGWAVGFSPTTGGGEGGELVAQALTISNGSSQSSRAAFLLLGVGIGNLLLVAGVNLALAERFAGIFQGDAHALPVLVRAVALLVRQCRACSVTVMQGPDQLEPSGAERYK